MRFATSSSRRSVHPFARPADRHAKAAIVGAGQSPLELFGACLMIACFLVMAMFG